MFSLYSIIELLIRLPALILSLTIHEFAHGLAAYRLGDTTAKYDGRLSLNPLRHIDPIGIICLLVFRFGWAKPVMVNPGNFENPKQDMAITSFAGPLSNLLLAFVCMLIYYPLLLSRSFSGGVMEYVGMFINECLFLNLSLAVFNLFPIPPLDGSKLFASILPDHMYFSFLAAGDRLGYILLLLLIWTDVISRILGPLIGTLIHGMFLIVSKIYFFL